MLLELLVLELVELLAVEELEEALVELCDVVPPVFVELHRHHDEVELPDGYEVRHDEGGQHLFRAQGEVAPAEYSELSVRQIQSL